MGCSIVQPVSADEGIVVSQDNSPNASGEDGEFEEEEEEEEEEEVAMP
jgi:hypothetical protein